MTIILSILWRLLKVTKSFLSSFSLYWVHNVHISRTFCFFISIFPSFRLVFFSSFFLFAVVFTAKQLVDKMSPSKVKWRWFRTFSMPTEWKRKTKFTNRVSVNLINTVLFCRHEMSIQISIKNGVGYWQSDDNLHFWSQPIY